MKNLLLILFFLISIQCYGNNKNCKDPLTNEQWEIFDNGNIVNDPVVYEYNEKSNKNSLTKTTQEKIDWNQAKQLILLGVINTVIQSHQLDVILISNSGHKYVSKEPKIDEILKIMEKVDPCFIFIKFITE